MITDKQFIILIVLVRFTAFRAARKNLISSIPPYCIVISNHDLLIFGIIIGALARTRHSGRGWMNLICRFIWNRVKEYFIIYTICQESWTMVDICLNILGRSFSIIDNYCYCYCAVILIIRIYMLFIPNLV